MEERLHCKASQERESQRLPPFHQVDSVDSKLREDEAVSLADRSCTDQIVTLYMHHFYRTVARMASRRCMLVLLTSKCCLTRLLYIMLFPH